MTELAVILGFAAAAHGIARFWRIPVIPLLILSGLILNVAGVFSSNDLLLDNVELGLTFLVFAAGIELNPRRMQSQRRAIFLVGFTQLLAMAVGAFFLAKMIGYEPLTALYIAFAMGTSSTLVAVRLLRVRQQMFEPFGRLVIGVLLLQDLIMIALIVVASRLPEGVGAVSRGLVGAVICGAVAWSFQRYVVPRLLMKLKPDAEFLLLLCLAFLFCFLGLVNALGLPPFIGAFLAGFSLSAFPVNGVVRGVLTSLTDFFQAVFFIVLGALVSFPGTIEIVAAVIFMVFLFIVTPPVVTLVAELHGLSSRAAIESGLLLAQVSEFSLVLGLTGLHFGHIDQATMSLIATISVLSMSLTPLLTTEWMTRRLLHFHPVRRRQSTQPVTRDHVLVLGFGSGGMWVVRPLKTEGYDMLVVDDDPVVIEQLQKQNIPCLRGDASDEKLLQKAGAHHAKFILAAMRRPGDARRVLKYAPEIPVIVRVFEERDAKWIESMGGIPILNSAAALETFLAWLEKQKFAL